MPGFPVRPSAAAIGPVMTDSGTIRNEARQAGARRLNLMRWQLAGCGQAGSLAWVMMKLNGSSDPTVEAHGSAWQGAAPTLTRTTTGTYKASWAAQYADETGTLVTIDLKGALVGVRKGSTRIHCVEWTIANAREVTIETRDSANALQDGADGLLLEVK